MDIPWIFLHMFQVFHGYSNKNHVPNHQPVYIYILYISNPFIDGITHLKPYQSIGISPFPISPLPDLPGHPGYPGHHTSQPKPVGPQPTDWIGTSWIVPQKTGG